MSFIKNYATEQTFFETCHHNITYGVLDFNVSLPPPYYTEIWDDKNTDNESIQKVISNFEWSKAFTNKKSMVNRKALMNSFINIFKNFIPHKTRKLDYKTPEWMNTLIFSALKNIKTFQKVLEKSLRK